MLDALLCLFTLAVGCVAVPALFWKSYGLDKRWAAFTSSWQAVPASEQNEAERRPQAVEQPRIIAELPVPSDPELIRKLAQLYSRLTEEERLSVLSLAAADDGEWLYAETRVARFIGGRVEDRAREVRVVRGEDDRPTAPQRMLTVRDVRGERVIAREG